MQVQRFGDLLKRFRVRAGLSQEALAERARMSTHSITSLERGARRAPYRDTVTLLQDALDLGPGDRALLGAAAEHGRKREPRAFVDTTPDQPANNLPAQLTSFVGRERDVEEIQSLLAANRIVTVTGAGGIGKTRVALESWNGEVTQLQKAGYRVIAPPNQLRGIQSDAASVAALLKTIDGPIVLVGHSYGGPVIEAAAYGNQNVKALVFVSAYLLDEGESVAGLGEKFPTSQLTPAGLTKVPFATATGEDVDLYVNPQVFNSVFASGLPESQATILQATQRPLAASALSGTASAPAWKSIPSWAVLSTRDLVIPPDQQQFMYDRAKAKITRVEAGHTALVSHPEVVTQVIEEAAAATR